MCEAWNDDARADLSTIERRLVEVLHDFRSEATARHSPSVDMVRDWHRRVHSGLQIPQPYYAGRSETLTRGFLVSTGTKSE